MQNLKSDQNCSKNYNIGSNNRSNSAFLPKFFDDPKRIPTVYSDFLAKCRSESSPSSSLLDTGAVYVLLKSSGLSDEILGQIWAAVNKTCPGSLTRAEFYAALALVALAQGTGVVRSLRDLENYDVFPVPKFVRRQKSIDPTLNATGKTPRIENDDDFTDFQSASASSNFINGAYITKNVEILNSTTAKKWPDLNNFDWKTKEIEEKMMEKYVNSQSNDIDIFWTTEKSSIFDFNSKNLQSKINRDDYFKGKNLEDRSKILNLSAKKPKNIQIRHFSVRKFRIFSLKIRISAKNSPSSSKLDKFPASSLTNCNILYDKYAAFRDLESNSHENDHHSIWSKLLRSCLTILQDSELYFRSIDDQNQLGSILDCDRAKTYLRSIIEIYALIRRLDYSSEIYGLKSIELSSLFDQIDEYWVLLIKILNQESILPRKNDLTYKNPPPDEHDSSEKYCAICLVRVDRKATNENSWSKTIGRKFLSYAGRPYHSSCANFWLNRVENLLPNLRVPNLLL